jgi:hypothetical protein
VYQAPVSQYREAAPVSTSAAIPVTPQLTAVAAERSPCESAIDSHIDGEFKGWEGETIYKLDNGEIWQQSIITIITTTHIVLR